MINKVNSLLKVTNDLMTSKYGQDIGKFDVITDINHLTDFYEEAEPNDIAITFDFTIDSITDDPSKCNEFDSDLSDCLEQLGMLLNGSGLSVVEDFDGSGGGLYYGHYIYR